MSPLVRQHIEHTLTAALTGDQLRARALGALEFALLDQGDGADVLADARVVLSCYRRRELELEFTTTTEAA